MRLWGSFPSCQRKDKVRVFTVGGQVGQQHADILHHLRVIVVEVVDILQEVEAAAALFQYCHSEGHQFWRKELGEFVYMIQSRTAPLPLLSPLSPLSLESSMTMVMGFLGEFSTARNGILAFCEG